MKGVVFLEFLEMVDERFGNEVTEQILSLSGVASGGAYTSVGTYDHSEIVALVSRLSDVTGLDVSSLVVDFGRHLIGRFYVRYPDYFDKVDDVTEFLEQVDGHIHLEVRKLYSDSLLPRISTQRQGQGDFTLLYESARGMGDLAEGMIRGAIELFGEKYKCFREDLRSAGGCQRVRFLISPRS